MSNSDNNAIQKFYPRLINYNKIDLNKEEEEILEKGLKHSRQPFSVANARTSVVADLTVKIGTALHIKKSCSETIRNTRILCKYIRSTIIPEFSSRN